MFAKPLRTGLFGVAFLACAVIGTQVPTGADATVSCEPGAAYVKPSPLPLASYADGLSVRDDGTTVYIVRGDTVQQVRDELAACAPRRESSPGYLAYTDYAVNWSYGVAADADGCRLTRVKVGVHISRIMPRLAADTSTPADVIGKWNKFIGALATHEDGHAALGTTRARALYETLSSFRAPCKEITQRANAATFATTDDLLADNETYDAETGHGHTQGAVW